MSSDKELWEMQFRMCRCGGDGMGKRTLVDTQGHQQTLWQFSGHIITMLWPQFPILNV